ncbi:hypothetical protein [Nocardiopsis sp. FIRDI 009]|nr:hypothetical protein [Nocardiopsis sp. FIRDI 009]
MSVVLLFGTGAIIGLVFLSAVLVLTLLSDGSGAETPPSRDRSVL